MEEEVGGNRKGILYLARRWPRGEQKAKPAVATSHEAGFAGVHGVKTALLMGPGMRAGKTNSSPAGLSARHHQWEVSVCWESLVN